MLVPCESAPVEPTSLTHALQHCGPRSKALSHDGLVVLKETDEGFSVLEDRVEMIKINLLSRGPLHKPADQDAQVLTAFSV